MKSTQHNQGTSVTEHLSLSGSLPVIHKNAGRLMTLINQAVPGAIRWIIVASLLDALVAICLPYTTRGLIDAILESRDSAIITLPLIWLAIEASLLIIRVISLSAIRFATRTIEINTSNLFVELILAKGCKVAYSKFENSDFLNTMSRSLHDAPVYGVTFSLQVIALARAALTFLGCLGLLLWVAPLWTISIIFAVALPTFFLDIYRARVSFALEHQHMHRNRKSWYLDYLLSTAEQVKEVRALGAGAWLLEMHNRVHRPFRSGQTALGRRYFHMHWPIALVTGVLMYVPYVQFVLSTISGNTSVGEMLFFILAYNQCANALLTMLGAFSGAFEHHLYVNNFVQFLDSEETEKLEAPNNNNVLPSAPELVIKDLWFTYAGSQFPVLKGFNLHVRAGETMAIVGRNGIGKSTLVKLLLRLYPVESGTVLLNDIDVSNQTVAWTRDNIGVVMQDFIHYQFSVKEGVGAGWLPDAENEELIKQALGQAQADEIVDSLPQGIDTPLGAAFGGRDLSGGQWQRLALARLFMRRSRVWVLDEPTSAMDPETEENTFRTFRNWTQGRTALIITHRFSTARIADRIAVVDDGKVVELGTHNELIQANGLYARMFAIQAQSYKT